MLPIYQHSKQRIFFSRIFHTLLFVYGDGFCWELHWHRRYFYSDCQFKLTCLSNILKALMFNVWVTKNCYMYVNSMLAHHSSAASAWSLISHHFSLEHSVIDAYLHYSLWSKTNSWRFDSGRGDLCNVYCVIRSASFLSNLLFRLPYFEYPQCIVVSIQQISGGRSQSLVWSVGLLAC